MMFKVKLTREPKARTAKDILDDIKIRNNDGSYDIGERRQLKYDRFNNRYNDVIEWTKENIKDDFTVDYIDTFIFVSEEDAMAFKLRWV